MHLMAFGIIERRARCALQCFYFGLLATTVKQIELSRVIHISEARLLIHTQHLTREETYTH